MAKSFLSDGEVIGSGAQVSNYIQQISTPEGTYDVAVKQGIRFYDGQDDGNGFLWDGSAPFEVVIPSVTDIVQDPVRMVGTVGVNGAVSPATYDIDDAAKGDLLYITADCEFQGVACEAGDMAIYDGAAWRVIQGENQVSILGGTTDASGNHQVAIGGSNTNVLTVEGKNLGLAIDYADVRSKVGIVKNNAAVTLDLSNATVTVDPTYIALSQASGSKKDISTPVSISLPSALASGVVTISDKVLASGDFTFTSGTFPTASKNAAAISVTTSHSMSIGKAGADGDAGDYVTSVAAIKSFSFANGTESSNALAYVSGLAAATGKNFVSGIHVFDSTKENGSADFEVPGAVSINAEANTFAYGFGTAAAEGDVLSSVSVGAVTIGTGSDVLTGLSGAGNTVVTSVSVGDLAKSTSLDWFLAGLGEASTAAGDVVSSVTIGAVSLVADSNASLKANAVVSASVSDHVLSFNTSAFMTPVALSKAADTVMYKSFNKAGVALNNTSIATDTFTKGGISQAATTMSYKSLLSKAVTLTDGAAVGFKFDLGEEHAYEVLKEYKNINYTAATVSKNSPVLENVNIAASIPAETVVVALNAGTLPTFAVGNPSATISGEVGTSLTTSNVSWLGVNESLAEIETAGAYTLSVVASTDEGAIELAAASTYGVANGTATIAANTFMTDVTVNGSATPQN